MQAHLHNFYQELSTKLKKENLISDELLCFAYSTDASMYRIIPQLVILLENETEAVLIMQLANQLNVKLTFRAAGTSLTGQALGEEVLVVLKEGYWLNYTINEKLQQIQFEPGHIAENINYYLQPLGKKIGPDPASINACKMGGILANNSSGMCCGTAQNSYQTLINLRLIFANGTILDTSNPESCNNFLLSHSDFINQIKELRQEILIDSELSSFIRQKFSIKNTSGYTLNSFLDFDNPIDIISHLLIGSEGTLGFISNATLQIVDNPNYKAVNLIFTENTMHAAQIAADLALLMVSAAEIMDVNALRSISHLKELAKYLIPLGENSCAILAEIQAKDQEELQQKLTNFAIKFNNDKRIIQQSGFLTDSYSYKLLWQTRKGILPSIAGKRHPESSVITEDIAVNLNLLPEAIVALQQLFERYEYSDAAIFGHALAGNIHFVFTVNFNDNLQVNKYAAFMDEFCELIIHKFNGSLKAEHGSGRNLAPYALLEWGPKAYQLMWKIKNLFDPKNILNPDVMLTKNQKLHIHNLKKTTPANELIDHCMECGFCEAVCPSRKLSLTPRQRIAIAREMVNLDSAKQEKWLKQYQYLGIETCATTGMCQTHCPVGIHTGEYILSLVNGTNKFTQQNIQQNIKDARQKISLGTNFAKIIGKQNLFIISHFLHKANKKIPQYHPNTPRLRNEQFKDTPKSSSSLKEIWIFPTCPKRLFAESAIANAEQKLLELMGYQVNYIPNYESLCCGQAYATKGNPDLAKQNSMQLLASLPNSAIILINNSSCSSFLSKYNDNRINDLNTFLIRHIKPNNLNKKYQSIALHIDCSSNKLGISNEWQTLLSYCSDKVVIPQDISCCGFAGDKGFNYPELNQSSLSSLAKQVHNCEIGVSGNRNCLIGLTKESQIPYLELSELLYLCWK